jgi:hypothetical protein
MEASLAKFETSRVRLELQTTASKLETEQRRCELIEREKASIHSQLNEKTVKLDQMQQEYVQDIVDFLGSMPASEVRKVLPREILDGLRKADVDDVLSQDPVGSRKPRTNDAPAPKREKAKRMTSDNFFKNLDKKWG